MLSHLHTCVEYGANAFCRLVALIELAEGPLDCSHMVICIERSIPAEEANGLAKGLQWAGFSLTTLDFWSPGFDVLSNRWLFMGMEV